MNRNFFYFIRILALGLMLPGCGENPSQRILFLGHPYDWRTGDRVDPRIEALKEKARAEGVWNLFLPHAGLGAGLSNADYAPVAVLTGHSLIAPEVFNCNAPDTGNMEVLALYGSEEQKERWLRPLLACEIRSAFCMTEPEVASSDATNMRATAVLEGNEVVLNGRKWWSSGLGNPHCRVAIFMGLSDPVADKQRRHSMVLVPLDTPGVRIERMVPSFGVYDESSGHSEVTFDKVRVPASNVIAGIGHRPRCAGRPSSADRASLTLTTPSAPASRHPYERLTPHGVLAALEAVGLRGDGRLLQLNSYENRVFIVHLEDGSPVVAKFYRPGRWTDAQILEEHAYALELQAEEVPVVPPMLLPGGATLAHHGLDG